jgi:mRNA-degrading endonuclease RelE of RelBE toxin-antitoxin system
MNFEVVHKETFTNQLLALPRDKTSQIIKKCELLRTDPAPDGRQKKKLHGYKGDVYRLRSGDYRIIYTFGKDWVALLGVDDRKDVYRGTQLVTESPTASITEIKSVSIDDTKLRPQDLLYVHSPDGSASSNITLGADLVLPRRIDDLLLTRLHIPSSYSSILCACQTVNDLYMADVPDPIRNRLFDVLTNPDFDQVMQQPDFVTGDVTDLMRFVDGELLGFLLKLSPEQERLAYWSLNAKAPTLLKGGPGTGKTIVALHRILGLFKMRGPKGDRARRIGEEQPRILFTTYTNSLVAFCEQQLRRLLGEDAEFVTVCTADSLARQVVTSGQGEWRPAHKTVEKRCLGLALSGIQTTPARYGLQQPINTRPISHLSEDYLLEEFGAVIEAREINTLDSYLDASRAGRHVRLGRTQKTTIWAAYQAFCQELAQRKNATWHQLRRRAVAIARDDDRVARFDAVIIDEAQDLDPTILRLLFTLCKYPNRVFLAADANQSIYGSGFRWTDVHKDLRFRGRIETLWVNQRSTREIGEAAWAYLGNSGLEETIDERSYARSGSKPLLCKVRTEDEEVKFLAEYMRSTVQNLRLGLGCCAVLVPTHSAGQALAIRMRAIGIPAQFMTGKDLGSSP